MELNKFGLSPIHGRTSNFDRDFGATARTFQLKHAGREAFIESNALKTISDGVIQAGTGTVASFSARASGSILGDSVDPNGAVGLEADYASTKAEPRASELLAPRLTEDELGTISVRTCHNSTKC